jgi:hypothetical protein
VFQVLSHEDGKVFFVSDCIPSATEEENKEGCRKCKALLSLKSVERLFATVVHFPTTEIKEEGILSINYSVQRFFFI